MAGFLNQVNRPTESNFRPFQNLVGEHPVEGDPASLDNLTKSDPDPLIGCHYQTCVSWYSNKDQPGVWHLQTPNWGYLRRIIENY